MDKGDRSKTRPGDMDYTTKKISKVYHEGDKDVKKKGKTPYKKGGSAEHMSMMRSMIGKKKK